MEKLMSATDKTAAYARLAAKHDKTTHFEIAATTKLRKAIPTTLAT